jgi:hypothetical protein
MPVSMLQNQPAQIIATSKFQNQQINKQKALHLKTQWILGECWGKITYQAKKVLKNENMQFVARLVEGIS